MSKPNTTWTDNSNKSTAVTYSSSTLSYNSSTTAYSGWDVSLPTPDKNFTDWNDSNKNINKWTYNASAVSSDIYDVSTTTYDTIYSKYDGNQSVTASPIQTKPNSQWSST